MQPAEQNYDAFFRNLTNAIPLPYKDALTHKTVERWLYSLFRRKEGGIEVPTAVANVRCLCEFSRFAKNDPDKMVESAQGSKKREEYRWEDKLEEWERKLMVAHDRDTARKKLITVKSFFEANRVELNYKLPSGKSKDIPWVPEKQILQKAFLSTQDKNLRRWILMQSQCGLSEIDILMLNVDESNDDPNRGLVFESIRKQLSRGAVPVEIVIPRKKTGVTTITYLGEEATSALEIHGLHFFPWKVEGAAEPQRNICKKFQSLSDKITEPELSPHKLRRYFETTLTFAGVNHSIVNLMMGHSQKGMERFYLGAFRQKLRQIYLNAYDELRLFEKGKLVLYQ